MTNSATNSAYFPVSTHLFEMKGKDARDFLHRLTTANIRDMEPGDFRPGFFLNPQGKIRALFRVGMREPDSFYLESEGGKGDAWKDALLGVIDQFTFAEKYELTEVKGRANVWIFGLDEAAENRIEERAIEGETLLLFHGPKRSFGTAWTSVWGSPEGIERFVKSTAIRRFEESEFEALRISSLFPRIDHEILTETNPLEVGLRTGIADNKGCYPGQEVIEKIVSLGSPAKRLALVEGTGPRPAPGSRLITEDGSEAGIVTSACFSEAESFLALALLRKTSAVEGKKLHFDGKSANLGIEVTVERISNYE